MGIVYDILLLFYMPIIISIIGGIVASFIIKFLTKTKSERTFHKNSKIVYRQLFDHISFIDSYKQTIYKMWESHPHYKNSDSMLVFNSHIYEEIQRFKKLIRVEIGQITLSKNSPYLLLSDYLLLQQYAWSAYTHLHEISNLENGMGIDNKSLEFHRFYAKEIIETFDNLTPKNFIEKWKKEFKKAGGIQFIVKPNVEPGDILSAHHNLRSETLYYDAQFGAIMKLLREIKELVKNKE